MKPVNEIAIVAGSIAAVGIASLVGYLYGININSADAVETQQNQVQPLIAKDPDVGASSDENTKQLLLYLIEEEKLAHDVYTVLYDKYGARVFGNILQSESTHQSRVLTLLDDRTIADPRKDAVGEFVDPDLQKLFDELIAKGMKSEQDAYQVGVTIEETDISDITKQLETASDVDVIQTLEDLRRGSENYLRAFNRQLSR